MYYVDANQNLMNGLIKFKVSVSIVDENFNDSRNWCHSFFSHGQECYTRLFYSGLRDHEENINLPRGRTQSRLDPQRL